MNLHKSGGIGSDIDGLIFDDVLHDDNAGDRRNTEVLPPQSCVQVEGDARQTVTSQSIAGDYVASGLQPRAGDKDANTRSRPFACEPVLRGIVIGSRVVIDATKRAGREF